MTLSDKLFENRERWLEMFKNDEYDKMIKEITVICHDYLFINDIMPKYDKFSYIMPYDNKVAIEYGIKYINASFVDRFIACQLPKRTHLKEFHEFLEKSEINLIVTLKEKANYFKKEHLEQLIEDNGLFRVEDYKLKNKTIRRVHCYIWEDHSVITPEQMAQLHSYIKKHPSFNDKHKTLIHCYAGVGRTGTMIMYSLLSEIDEMITPEIFVDLLLKLRSCRCYTVQNALQLKFLADIFLNKIGTDISK